MGHWIWIGAVLLLLGGFAGIGIHSLLQRPEAPASGVAALPVPPIEDAPKALSASDVVRFRVLSEPSGARVMLRGQEKGRTPFLRSLVG